MFALLITTVVFIAWWSVIAAEGRDQIEEDVFMPEFRCELFGGPKDGLVFSLAIHPSEHGPVRFKNDIHPAYVFEYRWDNKSRRMQYCGCFKPSAVAPGADCEQGEGVKQ